jgi:hypothetical protein
MATSKTSTVGAGLLFVAALAIAIAAGIGPARAQQSSWQQSGGQPGQPPSLISGLEILPTPYVWFPWTTTNATPNNRNIPSTSSTINPGQLIDHLTWVPFMGSVEFRSGDFGLVTDYVHAPLKSGVTTKGVILGSADTGIGLDTGTAMFLYRAWALPDQALDIGAGVRAWGLSGDITLNRRVRGAVNVSNGAAWADPMLAIRYHRDFGNGYSATLYGDVGGFGAGANVDWQVVGTIDYALKPGIDLHAGIRSLNFNYDAARANLALHMSGPILAATFRF